MIGLIGLFIMPFLMVVLGILANGMMCNNLSDGEILERCNEFKLHVVVSMILGGFILSGIFAALIVRAYNKAESMENTK